jgi:hypothetical protein
MKTTFEVNGKKVNQIEVGKYLTTYIDGQNEFKVMNFETKKEGIIKISNPEYMNSEWVENHLKFISGDNNLKVTRVTILDALN